MIGDLKNILDHEQNLIVTFSKTDNEKIGDCVNNIIVTYSIFHSSRNSSMEITHFFVNLKGHNTQHSGHADQSFSN